MMKHTGRIFSLLLALLMLLPLVGCGVHPAAVPEATINLPVIEPAPNEAVTPTDPVSPENDPSSAPKPSGQDGEEADPDNSESEQADEPQQSAATLDEDGFYYDVESVVLYLDAYGKLPGNFITKKQAQDLGWSGGSVERYQDGAAIGGDKFGNREGILPKANGRSYTECDIDTLGANSRGAKRLVFSSDGMYFYTDDHYEHFTELVVTEKGTVEWK